LKRTIETAAGLPYPKLTWKSLDELDAGVCDGMTYEEIEAAYPEDYEARDNDKYNYRYQGVSFLVVSLRSNHPHNDLNNLAFINIP
jgi:broad specificity phosphatase PhoE